MHTGKAEGHSVLELHVYYSNPCGLISYGNIFDLLSVPTSPMCTYFTLNAFEGKADGLSITHHITLQTRSVHANGMYNHLITLLNTSMVLIRIIPQQCVKVAPLKKPLGRAIQIENFIHPGKNFAILRKDMGRLAHWNSRNTMFLTPFFALF